jgi:enoyl-CoA hydratase
VGVASRTVRLERRGAVAAITIDRPEARNALTGEMRAELLGIFERLADDRDLRVVTLRGAGGKTFISGADIKEFAERHSAFDVIAQARRDEQLYEAIERLPAPVVAVIEGYAIGGGLALAAVCDLQICTSDSRFGVTSAKSLGNCLSPGMYARLAALIGPGRVKQLLLYAELIPAETARDWGLVTEVVERAELDARVDAVCERLSGYAPLTMWAAKEAMRRLVAGFPAGEDILERVHASEDFQEGVDAFLAKRAPRWRGC